MLKSVSYTHLDVYKRQLKYNRYINLDGKVDEFTEIDENYDLSQTIDIGDSNTTDTSEAFPKYDKDKNELRIPTILPPSAVINITITVTVQELEQDTTLTNIARVYGCLLYTSQHQKSQKVHQQLKVK